MDEDGVDVVEAIDAWIDEQIDDLTDDELESILEILDALSTSDLGHLDADDIYDDDIHEMVDHAGGSAADRAFTIAVLRAALFDESFDGYHDAADEDPDDDREADSSFLDDLENAHLLDTEPGDTELRDTEPSETDDAGHNNFLADLANTVSTTTSELVAAAAPTVVLQPFDSLGPSFLPEPVEPLSPRRHRRSLGRFLLPTFMICGLALFALGMMQLINSLEEDDTEPADVTTVIGQTLTAEPEATVAPTAMPPAAAPVDPSAPEPTATPEPEPPSRIGIRLVTGNIMVATYTQAGMLPEISLLYEVSDDLQPAVDLAWLAEGIGIVDTNGNVLVIDPDARRPQPTMIYEAGDGVGEAVEIASISGFVAVRTEDGNINLAPTNGRADPDAIQLIWDAEAEGAAATDLSAVGDLVPFVLDDGNALIAVTSDDNAVIPLWTADEQPPAFNVAASPAGILLGIGEGAVARYRLDDVDGNRLESVWDPFSGDEQPAIGYSPAGDSTAGDSTAVILGEGAIVLTESDNSGRTLWDPAETEIRALTAVGDNDHVVVLLETGSVVRIPLNSDELIESIWDITDETLSAANQLVVEPADG